jgi:hypothetical protein
VKAARASAAADRAAKTQALSVALAQCSSLQTELAERKTALYAPWLHVDVIREFLTSFLVQSACAH